MRRAAVVIVALLASSGCGTLWNGTRQAISFTSSPDGAEFRDLHTGERWTSPAVFDLERRHGHLLVVAKDGCRAEQVYIRAEVSSFWWGVGVGTAGVSLFFDAILGGLYDLEPEHVHVVLQPEPAQPRGPSTTGGSG